MTFDVWFQERFGGVGIDGALPLRTYIKEGWEAGQKYGDGALPYTTSIKEEWEEERKNQEGMIEELQGEIQALEMEVKDLQKRVD